MTLTKSDLIEELAAVTALTKKESEMVVETIFEQITQALVKGDKVELRGFGSFRVRHRNARRGRNPKTGTLVSIPRRRVPFFTVGRDLRQRVNTGTSEIAENRTHGGHRHD